jgi:hypothetical protein
MAAQSFGVQMAQSASRSHGSAEVMHSQAGQTDNLLRDRTCTVRDCAMVAGRAWSKVAQRPPTWRPHPLAAAAAPPANHSLTSLG